MTFGARMALRLPVVVLPALFALIAVLGCAGSAEERQLDAMREEIDNVRQSRDRADQVQPVTNQASKDRAMVLPEAYSPPPSSVRPAPSVVQIGTDGPGYAYDEDDVDPADPQDTTPRPNIHVAGASRGSGRRGEERVDHVFSDDGASTTEPSSSRVNPVDPQAKKAYDAAYALYSSHRYEQALDALAAFLLKWPDHPYANNAMYWRGECYFARGDYQRASEQFDGVLKRYPAGTKAPDALLKLGISQQKLGNGVKAKECFDRLAQQYPGTEAVRHIPGIRTPAAAPAGSAPEDH
jgi:tol-pal system protein YbgF